MEAGAKSWRKYHKWSSILTAMANKYAHYAENSDFGNKTWKIQTVRINIFNVKMLNSVEKSPRMKTTVYFILGHILKRNLT